MLGVNSLTAKPSVGRSEYGRVKVALPKGKGLMDWVRLTTGKILAKTRQPTVDHVELMKHNTKDDCWIHIFGQVVNASFILSRDSTYEFETVYDVTSYLDYHPGGIPELMRAAGRDATQLFNQYHAWVNYESMLKACLVGRFSGDLSKLGECGSPTVDETINTTRLAAPTSIIGSDTKEESHISVSVGKDNVTLRSDEWTSLGASDVVVQTTDSLFRILIRHRRQPTSEVFWEVSSGDFPAEFYQVDVHSSLVAVKFLGEALDLAALLEKANRIIRKRPTVRYHKCQVVSTRSVSHDTLLFDLRLPSRLHAPIPLGQHLSLKVRKGNSSIYRPYTPVNHSLPTAKDAGTVQLMVKIYSDGICTPALQNLQPGDSLDVSDPIGDADEDALVDDTQIVLLLAGGTGLTPMVQIIERRIKKTNSKNRTQLMLFNKTEADIVSDDWLPFSWEDDRVEVEHILSSPSESWEGRRGRINASFLPSSLADRVYICGPDGFVAAALRVLEETGYTKETIKVFQG